MSCFFLSPQDFRIEAQGFALVVHHDARQRDSHVESLADFGRGGFSKIAM
jgi:hypothetical protein